MAEEIILPLFDDSNVAITGGAASTSLKIRRGSDGYLLDWNDLTFKNAAWTTLATTFTEIDATNVAGYYKKSAVDISAWTDGWYQIVARYTGSPKRNAVAEWLIKGGKLVEQRTADNLDAAVSTRAVEANVETHVTASLNAYDPPTRTEATADKDAVIAQVDANEVKIDAIKAKTDTITWADITDLKDEALGKWVLDPTGNTLTLYKQDGVTVLKTFNLGAAVSAVSVYVSRTPV